MHKLITISHYTIEKTVTPIDPRNFAKTLFANELFSEILERNFPQRVFGGKSVLRDKENTRIKGR